jgi:hypothetical protein
MLSQKLRLHSVDASMVGEWWIETYVEEAVVA